MEKLQISPNLHKQALFINSYFPIDYNTLSIALLDSIGNETDTKLVLKSHAVNSFEVQIPKGLKGVFQFRIKDKDNYLIQKVIIQ